MRSYANKGAWTIALVWRVREVSDMHSMCFQGVTSDFYTALS